MVKSSIRVLHLFPSYLVASENWLFRLIDHLPNAEVVVASKHFFLGNFYPDKFSYIEFPIKKFDNPKNLLGLRALNVLISAILKSYPRYLRKTCGKCDLMHSHFATTGWVYRKLARHLRIPHVVSFYGFDYESLLFREPVWKRRYKELFREADVFLCEGAHGAEILQRIGCPKEKIRVARLGVDISTIPLYTRSKKPGELSLLQIANFLEKKGHRYSLEAFGAALKNCPNMTLTFVGSERQDNLKTKLRQKIKNTSLEGKVIFLEAIDFKGLYNFMKEYQVFMHPSCYADNMDCEGGAPVVLLDAQATGMPIISTTHCDIPDEVVHGHSGLLSPEHDSALLAQSIERFYQMDQEQYDAFARNARDHVTQYYSANSNFAAIRDIYDDILTNRR